MIEKSPDKTTKPIIGWREWVGLPELGIEQIKAKIDTGAKTSALHAIRIEETTERGVPVLHFYVHPQQRHKNPEIPCIAEISDRRKIRSSNGQEELRYLITTHLSLGDMFFPVDVSLTNRNDLGFRMLLGRDALKDQFIIDPSQSYLVGNIPSD